MMMKKTTSALAVAALLGTGAASAATFQVDENTTFSISGDVEAVYQDVKDSSGDSKNALKSSGSEIHFSGEHTADNGLTSFFRLGIDGLDVTNGNGTSDTDGDEAITQDSVGFIGLRGDFGSARFGAFSNAYDAVGDITDVMFDLVVDQNGRGDLDQIVQYSSNNYNGLSFVVDSEVLSSDEQADDQSTTSFSGRVDYDLGGATLMVGYDERGHVTNADERVGVAVASAISGISVAAKYEDASGDTGDTDFSVTGVTASGNVGLVTLFGVVSSISHDTAPTNETEDSFTQYGFGAYYSITPAITAHVETVSKDLDDDEGDGYSAGLSYKF